MTKGRARGHKPKDRHSLSTKYLVQSVRARRGLDDVHDQDLTCVPAMQWHWERERARREGTSP